MMFRGMQIELYLKCKCTEHKAKQQALVRNVAHQHLQRGQIGRSHSVIRAESRCKQPQWDVREQEGRHHGDIHHMHWPQTAKQQTCVFICSVPLLLTSTTEWVTHHAAPSPRGREPDCRGKTGHPWPELRSGKPFAAGRNTHIKHLNIKKTQLFYQQTHVQKHKHQQTGLQLCNPHMFEITLHQDHVIQGFSMIINDRFISNSLQ